MRKTGYFPSFMMAEKESECLSTAIVIDPVLCYVSTARHSMRSDDIVRVCLAFFKEEDIINAKDKIFEIAGVKPKRRRNENRLVNEMEDLLDILKKCDENKVILPKYVSDSFDSMPPTSGFEVIAGCMRTFIDEIAALKEEVKLLKESRLSEEMGRDEELHMREDIIAIKGELRKLNHKLMRDEVRRNSLLLQSLDKSSVDCSGKCGDANEKENGNLNSEMDSGDDNFIVSDGLCGGADDVDELPECSSEFQCANLTPSLPSYADVASVNPASSFSPSAPPLSQEPASRVVGGGGDGGGARSLSPSAPPPLSQVPNSSPCVRSSGMHKLNIDSDGFVLVERKKKNLILPLLGQKRVKEVM